MEIFILAITCIFNLLLAVIVLSRDARKSYARVFALMCLFLTGWIVTNHITNHSPDNLGLTNIANKLTFVSGFMSVMGGLVFTYLFPVVRVISLKEKTFLVFLVVLPSLLSFTEGVAGIATLDNSGALSFSVGEWLWLYGLAFITGLGLIARNLFLAYKTENTTKRKQITSILLAFILCAGGGLIFNVVIPVLTNDWSWTKFGPLATVFLVGIIGYTIIRHGLFDIRLAVVRGVAYFMSLTTLAGLYYVLAFTISELMLKDHSGGIIGQNPISILLALVLAFIFQPIKNFFDRLTSKIFYRDEYNTDDFFAAISRQLSETTDLKMLLRVAAEEIATTIKAEHAYFFVRYGDDKHLIVGTSHHARLKLEEIKQLDHLVSERKIVVADILDEGDRLREMLTSRNIAIVQPLYKGDDILGYLFLGHQKGRSYTKRDVRALETISDELVIAIQNALSVQEVKEINETLQQRIEEATKELRTTNSQLQRLDEAKDEFISMASHQLRTPLTSVKGYISMVLEEDAGKISVTQRQLLGEAFASSERMVHLINDFLNVSRLQTGKFMLELRPIDLAKLVAVEIESLTTTAQMHNLKIRYKKPPRFPLLTIDEGKVRQVIMNFIDNAIYYSHEGTEIIVDLSIEDGQVVLRVKDTGIGVPKEEQAHLFSKFFRATNARKQRPDGTGVGLFLAKKVIAAHGGTMMFESEEGKGSTFGFRLPIRKLAPKDPGETKKLKK